MQRSIILMLAFAIALPGCRREPAQALGSLEYDRITVPAPAAERIVAIHVREGQQVEAGTVLMTLDRTRTEAQVQVAEADTTRQRAVLSELEAGPRREAIAQARAQAVTLEKLDIVAPRAGRIDSLPYKLGDQAPVGAPLVVMLADGVPHARIYVLEPQRAGVKVGDALSVQVDGRDGAYRGTVRMIRNEASFTPYFALAGKDAARLSYLAEVQLDDAARDLPAGLPVRVVFGP